MVVGLARISNEHCVNNSRKYEYCEGQVDVGLEEIYIADKIHFFFKEKIRDPAGADLFMKLHTTAILKIDNSSQLSYHFLKENGLKGVQMGPRKLEAIQYSWAILGMNSTSYHEL